MKTTKPLPPEFGSSRRAQPLRQTRTNPPRSSIEPSYPMVLAGRSPASMASPTPTNRSRSSLLERSSNHRVYTAHATIQTAEAAARTAGTATAGAQTAQTAVQTA
ncbi:hypothetical protein OIDMADRAFT_24717 [Oidiodendron maius Zn]|uniref:Uncharacterized protein n=1 Tax=Oidiodendron maius (strain Zn) TaxID=913774 RepID=A0A0C3DWB8_OIDMZ|nr:hypothetical protein OIDMADRAFT_24717 [Oidiodendron maius Zn]